MEELWKVVQALLMGREDNGMGGRSEPVAFVGAGTIAECLIRGMTAEGGWPASKIVATVRCPERADILRRRYGIHVTTDNLEAARGAGVVLLCVKPADLAPLAQLFHDFPFENRILVSVVAGVPLARLQALFRAKHLCRANPNPQIATRHGFTAITCTEQTDETSRQWLQGLFGVVGEVAILPESSLDAVSALSGIAHSLYIYEAFVDAGVYLGLSRQVAEKIAFQSMAGTMALINTEGKSSTELMRQAVTPGGVSAEKLYVFEKHGLRGIVMEAMRAAVEKARMVGAG